MDSVPLNCCTVMSAMSWNSAVHHLLWWSSCLGMAIGRELGTRNRAAWLRQGGGKNAVAGIGKKCGKMRKKCGKCEKKCGIKCGFAKML